MTNKLFPVSSRKRGGETLYLFVILLLLWSTTAPEIGVYGIDDWFDPGGCTTAVIAGSATANGRPLLWKNRDVSFANQEIMYLDDGIYPYVTIITASDTSNAWGGVNSTGFAIEDANNWNTTDPLGAPEDDGTIIKLALQTCRTVDDFQAILDSTQIVGHRTPAIFGVIDSAGGGAMFETFTNSYVRYDVTDPQDAPLGILVRSNWSYAGSTQGRIGVYRHNRAKTLIENASNGDSLTAAFMFRHVMRDLRNETGFNPYPLPYEGTVGGLPRGWISTYGAVCRRLTVSACVIEGVLPNEDPLLSTLWAFPMSVQYGVPLPFWVASRTTPVETNGPVTSALCDQGWRIRTMAQHYDGFRDTLDTYILDDSYGGGVLAMTYPLEDEIVARTDSALAVWRAANAPDSAGMTTLTQQLATHALDVISIWPQPGDLTLQPMPVNNLTLYKVPVIGLRLRWSAVTQNIWGWPQSPATGYSIWRMDNIGDTADSIGYTTATQFVVPGGNSQPSGFFQVKAVLNVP